MTKTLSKMERIRRWPTIGQNGNEQVVSLYARSCAAVTKRLNCITNN